MLRHRRRVYTPQPIREWKGPKPELPMAVTLICRIHFRALEAYLAKVYRMREYDARLASGAAGDMAPEYTVTGTLPPAVNMAQQTDNIRRGRRTRDLGLILNVLCIDGFIPVGEYVIDISEDLQPIQHYAELLNASHDPSSTGCMDLKKKHRGDREFVQRVKMLDQLMITAKHELEDDDGQPG
jgi:hypothetical protein